MRRDGDTWYFTWSKYQVGFGLDHLKESSEGIHAELTVESIAPGANGRLAGPVRLNMLSARTQAEIATKLEKRVNGAVGKIDWDTLVTYACAVVAKQYRAPTPILNLAEVEASTAVDYLVPGLIPSDETTVLYGDGECVAAGSVVQGPAGNERVEVLARRGLPVPVWTLGASGQTWAWASAPWLKGQGVLMRFTLDGGRAITVAGRHRFLTPQGWRFASELAAGEQIAVAPPSPHPSIAGRDPRVSLLSAQHCSQRPGDCRGDCRGDCWPYCRRYGPRLRRESDGVLAFAPSPTDALGHTLSGWHRDARASSVERSLSPRSGPPSSADCVPYVGRPSDEVWSGAASHATPHFESNPTRPPSLLTTALRTPTGVCPRHEIQSSLGLDHSAPTPSLPPLAELSYRTIVAVSIVGEGDYYDLSVPGTQNYLANGIWHHNSAKSLLVLRIACSVVSGMQLPWEDRPTRVCPVLYLDWETNPRTVAGRLQRISLGMLSAIPQVYYRQCFRTLQDELPHIREEVSKRDIGLVIVDSIGFAASGALVEDETARSTMNALRQLSPATRLVVAHISAQAARSTAGAARPFGSAFFWNGMRSGLELRRAEEGADPDSIELGLYHRKANDGEHHKPIGISTMFDGRQGPISFWRAEVSETPDLAARTPLSSRLRDLLRRGSRDAQELAEETESTTDTVLRTLKRMPDVQRLTDGPANRGKVVMWGLVEA